MRILSESAMTATLSSLPVDTPRVVASGNYGTPQTLLKVVDVALPAYRLFMLNAQTGVPIREGVTLETPFVGVGMRDQPALDYIPSRLSLVPVLFTMTRPPDVVLAHTSAPVDGTVSMGIEVNILPAAVEAFAQANAARRQHRIYSGFGGQTDFIVGALHSPDGKAIIALPSWHPRANCSTVVPVLESPVTSFQHSHIISERGTASIWGCDQPQQAQQMIEHVAHPSVHEELTVAAERLGLR